MFWSWNFLKFIAMYYYVWYGVNLVSVVISIRIPRELKERLEELNVNVSKVVREFLEKYVSELELKRLREELRELRERLSGRVDPITIANLVREDRDSR